MKFVATALGDTIVSLPTVRLDPRWPMMLLPLRSASKCGETQGVSQALFSLAELRRTLESPFSPSVPFLTLSVIIYSPSRFHGFDQVCEFKLKLLGTLGLIVIVRLSSRLASFCDTEAPPCHSKEGHKARKDRQPQCELLDDRLDQSSRVAE